jgi:hypothetical protein
VIAGVRSVEQLRQNLRALDTSIDPEEREDLRALVLTPNLESEPVRTASASAPSTVPLPAERG